ncbi:unnamed protein product [Cunninghamella blakesleeana]
MSHQSGIKVSEELSKTFTDAVSSGNVRIIRISIVNESLVNTGITNVQGTFEQDFNQVEKYLEDKTPAYILVRLDEKTSIEYKWLFLCYVPDDAKVRDKMIYASTRASLTKELGDSKFTDSIYGTQKSEFSWDGYKKHLAHQKAEAPLTQREKEMAEIKEAEARAVTDYQGASTRKTYAPGVSFPLTSATIEALRVLNQSKDGRSHNFVSLYLNNETIDLDEALQLEVDELKNKINKNAPRFLFYSLEHEHHGETTEAIVFIYTCPSTSKIRERMLYSTSKANVITGASNEANITVLKKYETSDPSDITEEYLLEDLYPISSSSSASSISLASSQDQITSFSTDNIVSNRIQMLGGSRGGFKRPVAPGRRKPTSANTQS